MSLVDEHRRVALQRPGLVGVEVSNQRLEIEIVDGVEDRLNRTLGRVGTAGHERHLGNVVATVACILGDRVERAEIPASVVFHRCQFPIEIRILRCVVEVGTVAAERLIDQQVADRHAVTIDRSGAGSGDANVGDVVDVGGARFDLHVVEHDVEPADLVEAGGAVDDVESLEVADDVDQRLAHHVALAWQQKVDDAQRILGRQRIHQTCADFSGARRAAIVAGNDLADRKPAGADQCDDGDQAADHLALAALSMSTGRHDGGRRLTVLRDEGQWDELWRTRW